MKMTDEQFAEKVHALFKGMPPKKIKVTFNGKMKAGSRMVRAAFTRYLEGVDVMEPTFNALFADYF